MDYSRSLPNDMNNKMNKTKKDESKPLSDSSCSPDSYNHNSSNKKNWKLLIAQDGELFFIKRSKKSATLPGSGQINNNSPSSNQRRPPLNLSKLSTIKNVDINKELYLIVSSMDRYRFGRRSSIIESMLGFGVIPFSDNFECLMITNIIDKSLTNEYPYIQEGDWFKSMDNIEVRTENIDKLLMQYTRATKVRLTFKSAYAPQNNNEDDNLELGDLHSFDDFALSHRQLYEHKSSPDSQDNVFLTLIIHREYFQDENNDFLFYYPFLSNNFLYTAKGSFLTLDSLISNDLRSKAIQSTITVNNIKYFITYGHLNDMLVVSAFASTHQSKHQTKSNSDDFLNFLKFSISDYQGLRARQDLGHVCDIFKNNIIDQNKDSTLNLGFLAGSSLGMSLPKEAQLRICDALSEFESMDHKKWNETHKTSSDLIVCGTSLYYGRWLLSSNLPADLRISIECYLRVKGMSSFPNIKEMYIWEEIKTKIENNANKHYLGICLCNNLMLITVLKSPQHQLSNSDISCIPYMEEIANTVDYLLSSGIDCISQFWIDSAKRPSMKKMSQFSATRKFTIQKDISLDCIDADNVVSQESLPHSLLSSSQSEDGVRRNLDSESLSDGFNDFKEHHKDYESIGPLLNEVKNIMPMNWTAGWSNDLKFFLHWNCADAVIMSPLKSICSEVQLSVMKENIVNIHNLIYSNYNCKKKQRDTLNANWNRNLVLREHGICVNLKNHDSEESETIFIIGRLFGSPLREIFVCFGPNFSQNLVELAFRMSLLNVG
ncbi:protein inturned [Eupeodes corollae]|uniref:protein inturned n=1 Tax=Eupeodes corollae TaxID=290404 RepID=UPI0024917F83|nr:protein inturned [Eupeodes corollae]